jgi:hypothetical protein
MVGTIGMIVLPIVSLFLARVAYPTKIDDQYAWLKVGQPFLDSLPPLRSPAACLHMHPMLSC